MFLSSSLTGKDWDDGTNTPSKKAEADISQTVYGKVLSVLSPGQSWRLASCHFSIKPKNLKLILRQQTLLILKDIMRYDWLKVEHFSIDI